MLTRNSLSAKVLRQFTSLLPVSHSRQGRCLGCGDCCRLPYRCPFLRSDGPGHARCAIYLLRPISCRRYPRTPEEHLTKGKCGFRFD
ncbi:MAG: hypothetical protein BWZ02_03066 [Lentisphaerae bacterium ADurb.BinA184]|nr:MAG: hypothetical protein BWZ02_03066 [Lentisphaerae bacterium ADurb.BinA184]